MRLTVTCCSTILVVVMAAVAPAAPPPGYYDSVDETDASTLRTTLHNVIDDHQRFPYTSSATDTWNVLEAAQEDPNNSNNIIDVYRNRSHTKIGGGTGPYNREHSWPKSYGFPNDNSSNYPYTDCYQLFLCDSGYNSSRSNKPFQNCNGGCLEKTTDATQGQGGGSGSYPGNSSWTSGSNTQGTWETWVGRRGDIARAQFYLDVRYEGGTHGITGVSEPDLILTDSEALIDASHTGSNESVAYMGMLSVLLQWHAEDPVDDWERNRNDVVSSFQGNRNPFIDHPEWVDCIFSGNCGGASGAPAAPNGLSAMPGDGFVDLDWADNAESDLEGYNAYRSTTPGGSYLLISTGLLTESSFSDTSVINGTTYYYVVTAINTSEQESASSGEVSATLQSGGGNPPGQPWINELHYDNSSGDTGEFVEIAGPADTDLTNWTVLGYNGNGGGTYKQVDLSGVIPDQGGCMGTLAFAFIGMQNGAPDGLALVDPSYNVVQFISYEGVLVATGGLAAGMTSVDIGISEQPAPPVGQSLQLSGTGVGYEDFFWLSPGANTEGLPNTGQTFDGCDACPDDPFKTEPGVCGCGVPDTDGDVDGTPDCNDLCPADPNKIAPGSCGCGVPDAPADGDMNGDGFADGGDIQWFVEAVTGGAASQSDVCHGDFDGTISLDMGDASGFVAALLTP